MEKHKKIVIIGATSAIAEHCARLWVDASPVHLILVGRNTAKLEKISDDLSVRSPLSIIDTQEANFIDPHLIGQLVDNIATKGRIDLALIAHGSLPDQSECQNNLTTSHAALTINATSPVLFAEAIAKHMQEENHGTLAIISSVAGERGRKSNYVYGSAKGLITRYAQGLQHRFANTGVKVIIIKPGPTDTPMTMHLQQEKGSLADVNVVSQLIVKGILQGKPVIYAPHKWSLIMFVIRCMPQFLFNKMDI